ncbi:MAG: LytR/AlgR family response regulator transcription factor [Thermonemataceae bacterium]
MLKVVVLEDEKAAQALLLSYIEKVPFLTCIGIFETGLHMPSETLQAADILFLDIQLPELNGIAYVKTLVNAPKVIVTSAFSEYALEAFEISVTDYLLKPFDFERFLKAVTRVQATYFSEVKETYQYLYTDKTLHKIKTSDILYLQAQVDYLAFMTIDQKILIHDSLKNWVEKLSPYGFVQCHRSYVVNIKAVKNISQARLTIGEVQLPVSTTYRKELIAKFEGS